MNILLTGAFGSVNRGDAARVKTSIQAIRKHAKDAKFTFMTTDPATDQKIYRQDKIEVIEAYPISTKVSMRKLVVLSRVLEIFSHLIGGIVWRLSGGIIKIFRSAEFTRYDMFIDLSGESLTDYYGQVSLLKCLYPLALGSLLRRKVVVYGQSIGPFDRPIGRLIAQFVLNRVSLIITRDEYSMAFLKKYKITKAPTYRTTDPAFILKPVAKARVEQILQSEGIKRGQANILIGVAASRGSFRRSVSGSGNIEDTYQQFLGTLAQSLDSLIEQLNAAVIFIPHVISARQDDRDAARKIYKLIKNQDRVTLVEGEYTTEELKGLIAECDLFIGSRMHANIAALSSLVPTVAIAYSHKMLSLMEGIELTQYVCNIETVTVTELTGKVSNIWQNKIIVIDQLKVKMDEMKRKTEVSAKLVMNLYNNKSSNDLYTLSSDQNVLPS
jgi:colanic acid/amylovoran biosynthesis protein